jgi:hypothetical protein
VAPAEIDTGGWRITRRDEYLMIVDKRATYHANERLEMLYAILMYTSCCKQNSPLFQKIAPVYSQYMTHHSGSELWS